MYNSLNFFERNKHKVLELSENLTIAPLQSFFVCFFFFRERRTMMGNKAKLNLVSVDAYTKFGQIISIHSQTIEWKLISDVIQRL